MNSIQYKKAYSALAHKMIITKRFLYDREHYISSTNMWRLII